jgi:hypothetical protein
MRKATIAIVLLAAVAAFMLVSGFGRVATAKADNNGATHYVGVGPCLLDSAGGCVANTYTAVSNHGGIEVDKYSADGVFNDTGAAVHWSNANTGLLCQSVATGAITDDWSETISASGNAMLTCKFTS